MNKLFAQLLQQAASRSPQAVRAVRGFADDLAAPVVRSVGTVEDILVRPAKTFYGKLISPATAYPPGTAALNLVKQNVGRFTPSLPIPPLRMPAPPATNVGQVGGILQNLKSAAQPYFTPSSAFARVPVLGSMPGWAQSLVAPTSVAGTILGLTQLEGSSPQASDPYDRWQQLGYSSKDEMIQKVTRQAQIENASRSRGQVQGPLSSFNTLLKNDQGKIWSGRDYGYQSPESFNALFGTNLPTSPGSTSPPDPTLPPLRDPGSQAGQLTVPAGTLSNGAGDPRQRQNVLNRSLSQEVLNAAQQYAAPTNVPLSAFYEGQQQLGRSMMQQGNLVSELQRLGAAPGMAPENLKAWAQANPDLAYREFLRLKQNQ